MWMCVTIKKVQDIYLNFKHWIQFNINLLNKILVNKRLQEQVTIGTPLNDALKKVDELLIKINNLDGPHKNKFLTKQNKVLNKNIGYEKMCKISKVLNWEENDITNLKLPAEDLTANDILHFKYTPIAFTSVERIRYR